MDISKLTLLIICVIVSTSMAEDTLQQAFETPSPLTKIQNGRHRLHQLLNGGNLEEAGKLYRLMYDQLDTTNYNLFNPFERVALDMLLGRFFFLSHLSLIDTINGSYDAKAAAPDDGLSRNMKTILQKNKYEAMKGIEKLDEMNFVFGSIFLDWLSSEYHDSTAQRRLNDEADDYLKRFPGGEQADYIRSYIRRVYKQSDWGMGFSFFTGYGFEAGEVEATFGNPILLGHSFDFFYKKIGLVFYNQFGGRGKIKDSTYTAKDVWPKGARVTHYIPAIHLGYLFVHPKFFLFPYIGVSTHSADISDTSKYNKAEIPWQTSPLMGVTIDWRIGRTGGVLVTPVESGSWVVRTDVCLVNTRHDRYDRQFSGYMVLLKVGVGGIAWPIKRDGLPKKRRGE